MHSCFKFVGYISCDKKQNVVAMPLSMTSLMFGALQLRGNKLDNPGVILGKMPLLLCMTMNENLMCAALPSLQAFSRN